MANEGKNCNINNGEAVVKRFKKEPFPEKFGRMRINESGTGKVTISEESIKNNSKFIANLFDEQ